MSDSPDNIVPITQDARTAAKKFSGEHDRELLTILFTDLVESMRLQSDLGNVEAARLTELHRKIVRDELARYDAREIEWAGDSCLAVFEKPSDAVVFALRMQAEHRRFRESEPKLPLVRVGMHLGEIVVKKGATKVDLFGLQVSEAARVMEVAEGNQIYCTKAVFDNARNVLRARASENLGTLKWLTHGQFVLKGIADPTEICEVGDNEWAPLAPPAPTQHCVPVMVADGLLAAPQNDAESRLRVQRVSINIAPDQPLNEPGFTEHNVLISPDGSQIIYVADLGDHGQLVLRPLDRLTAEPIPGTEGARNPFFSPDGHHVAFFCPHEQVLRRVSLDGAHSTTLCSATLALGGVWSDDDRIFFASEVGHGILCVPATGGHPEEVVPLDTASGHIAHVSPNLLPGNRALLFACASGMGIEQVKIVAFSFDTGRQISLVEHGTTPKYVPTGHIVYARLGALMAIPFDPNRLEIIGPPANVTESRMIEAGKAPLHYGISRTGSLVYATEQFERSNERTLAWVGLDGEEEALPMPPRHYQMPRLSPDGNRVAVTVVDANGRSIWIYDIERETFQRLTFGPSDDHSPLWTPDGTRIVFASKDDETNYDLCWMPADGSLSPDRLTTGRYVFQPNAWTADGKTLLYTEISPTGLHIAILQLNATEPVLLTSLSNSQSAPAISPDESWLAYTSTEGERPEVIIQSYPDLKGRWQVSHDGGLAAVWAPDGSALYYVQGRRLLAVDVHHEDELKLGKARVVFEGDYVSDPLLSRRMYDIDASGTRFLVIREGTHSASRNELVLITNWFEELKRLAPHQDRN